MYLSTTPHGREELNDFLTDWYVLAYKFAKFGNVEGSSEQDLKLALKGAFPILAGGNCS